ncbi:acyl-CoA thioesterase [Amycolatopsis sp. NPDC003865]
MTPAAFTHRVRYHETDAQGFLFNSRYLELADVAMTEYFRALGFPYGELNDAGMDPSVVKATVDCKRPARFDDALDVTAACTRVGRSSFDLAVAVARDGQAIAEVNLTYVNVEAQDATSRRIPAAIAGLLRRDASGRPAEALEIHQESGGFLANRPVVGGSGDAASSFQQSSGDRAVDHEGLMR